jgi:hypothetical protein
LAIRVLVAGQHHGGNWKVDALGDSRRGRQKVQLTFFQQPLLEYSGILRNAGVMHSNPPL